MANESDIVKKSEAFLNDIGMTATEWLLTMGKYKSHILQLDDTSYKKFAELYEKIINKDFTQTDKGKMLEDLTALLLYQDIQEFLNVEGTFVQAAMRLIYNSAGQKMHGWQELTGSFRS